MWGGWWGRVRDEGRLVEGEGCGWWRVRDVGRIVEGEGCGEVGGG